MASNSKKRRTAPVVLEENPGKRIKLATANAQSVHILQPTEGQNAATGPSASQVQKSLTTNEGPKQSRSEPAKSADKRPKIRKLEAPRPFPAVAPSSSATGPRSAQKEGKNYICLTRKTSLGAYMRKCKNLVLDDGYDLLTVRNKVANWHPRYKVLHLHAMGAAIPLLVQLSCALPPILPFSKDEIHTEISTGTVSVQDEVIPCNEDEDVAYNTREKSTLYVVIRIGDGQSETDGSQQRKTRLNGNKPKSSKPRSKAKTDDRQILIYEEPEQEQEDI